MTHRMHARLRRALTALALIGLFAAAAVPVVAEIGDPVIQGRFNQVDRKTSIVGTVGGDAMLRVANRAPDGTGLTIQVEPGNPPLKVNSGRKVKKLNADRLDGWSSEDFIRDEGVILVTVSDSTWRPMSSTDPIEFDWSGNTDLDVTRTATGSNWLYNEADTPTVLFGRSVEFLGVELCYDAARAGVTLTAIEIDVPSNTDGEPDWITPIFDSTARNDVACRVYTPDRQVILARENVVQVWINVEWTSATTFELGRLTAIFGLTDIPAAAPALIGRETAGGSFSASPDPGR